jgi:uncharacterized membrane protein
MTRTARSAVIVSLSAGLTTVALWGVPDALRAAGAVPLALVLPGHALVTALFPRWLPWLDRIALAVAISIVVCVLGGFALHWSPAGLTSESWILFLVLTSVAAYFAAWLRWRAGGPSVASPRSRASFHTARREALFVVQAVALAAVALGIARTPLPAKDVSGYTALSLLPAGSGSSRIGVEITSAELRKTQYRLELHVGGWRVYSQRLALAPGERWRAASDIAAGAPSRHCSTGSRRQRPPIGARPSFSPARRCRHAR